MVKSTDDVIADFNEVVNMTAEELEAFLDTDASNNTGQKKDDGSGEAIGHESGRKILDILKRNPEKDPSKYTEEDQEHMRRVVSYCKRHLAQESHLKEEKTEEELEKMKSTLSLKNWGHDPLKASASAEGGANEPKSGKPTSKKAEKNGKEEEAAGKPASKGGASKAKPASKKGKATEKVDEEKEGETKEAGKPKSKAAAKPSSKKAAASAEKEKKDEAGGEEAEAGAGEKRAAGKAEKADKPASKKAKTEKPKTEATRKPPSRSAKKA